MTTPQAMFHHPVIAIQTGVQNFSLKSKPISLKLQPGRFEKIKEKIIQEIEKFTTFTDATIQQFELTTDADILKYQEEGKRDIFMSALAPDFVTKYSNDIIYEDTYDKLSNFVTDVIGSQSAAAKSKEAEEKMSALTRDSDADEKFTRFLIRLERLAEIITDKADFQQYLVSKHFRRALTPSLKSLLKEREKGSETPLMIAKFLDGLGKNKRTVDLNQIEASATRDDFQQLHEELVSFKNEMREALRFHSTRYNEIDSAELNAIKTKPTANRQRPVHRQNDNFRPNDKFHQNDNFRQNNNFPPHWEINRYGRPFRCRKCGLRGHRDENCRGTTLICRICEEPGHIQPACPQRAQSGPPKNL